MHLALTRSVVTTALATVALAGCGGSSSPSPAQNTAAPTPAPTSTAAPAVLTPGLQFSGPVTGRMTGTVVDCSTTQPLFAPYEITARGSVGGGTITLLVYLDSAGDLRSSHVKVYNGSPESPVDQTPQWETPTANNGLQQFDQSVGLALNSDVPAVGGSGASGTVHVSGSVPCPAQPARGSPSP